MTRALRARALPPPAARLLALPRRRAVLRPRCERVPTCLLDAIRRGARPLIELRGKTWAVVAEQHVQARRKAKERAQALLEAALVEVEKSKAPEGIPAAERRRGVLITPQRPSGEPVRYEVVPAKDVVPSHKVTDFSPDPRYPAQVQERAYHLEKREQQKVIQGAQQLNPELVLARTPSALDGPPIVTEPDVSGRRLVMGGNGRSMMILRAYSAGGAAGDAYREALIRRAGDFGLEPAAVRQVERPVLVRVLEGLAADAPREVLVSAVRRTNEGLTQALDAKTLGVARGRQLSAESVAQLGEALGDGELTLRELMAARSEVFREALQRDSILTPSSSAEWVQPSGALTDEGKDKLEAMFVGLVLGTPDRVRATPPAVLQKVERAVPFLMAVRGQTPTFDLVPVVQGAVDLLVEARGRDLALDELLRQVSLFGREERDPRAVAVAELLETRGPRQVADAFRGWSKVAIHDPRQEVMFGTKPTQEEAFRVLTQGRRPNPRGRSVAAAGQTCARCAGGGKISPWAGKIDPCPTCGGKGRLFPLALSPGELRDLALQRPLFSNPGRSPMGSPTFRLTRAGHQKRAQAEVHEGAELDADLESARKEADWYADEFRRFKLGGRLHPSQEGAKIAGGSAEPVVLALNAKVAHWSKERERLEGEHRHQESLYAKAVEAGADFDARKAAMSPVLRLEGPLANARAFEGLWRSLEAGDLRAEGGVDPAKWRGRRGGNRVKVVLRDQDVSCPHRASQHMGGACEACTLKALKKIDRKAKKGAKRNPAKRRRNPRSRRPGSGKAAAVNLESKATGTRALAKDLRRRFGAVLPRRINVVLLRLKGKRLRIRRAKGGGLLVKGASPKVARDLERDLGKRTAGGGRGRTK